MTKNKHITVIGGSVRPHNYTMRAVELLRDELEKSSFSYEIIDPASLELHLPGGPAHEKLQEKVKNSMGVILASPEYHGGISSVMKLVIDNLGFPSALAGKPIALLGVAAGAIGAIKSLEQIRSICSHIGAIVLPGGVSIARVQELFDEKGYCHDKEVEERIRGVVTALVNYMERHILPCIALENIVRSQENL